MIIEREVDILELSVSPLSSRYVVMFEKKLISELAVVNCDKLWKCTLYECKGNGSFNLFRRSLSNELVCEGKSNYTASRVLSYRLYFENDRNGAEILLQSIFERSLAIINSKFVQGMSYI